MAWRNKQIRVNHVRDFHNWKVDYGSGEKGKRQTKRDGWCLLVQSRVMEKGRWGTLEGSEIRFDYGLPSSPSPGIPTTPRKKEGDSLEQLQNGI